MTDNEIKKVLECKPKAELIEMCNRLQAENEKLKNAYKQCAWERDTFLEQLKTDKTEAYKECILKVKEETKGLIGANFLDNLLKELVGDK